MDWIRVLLSRCAALFRRRKLDEDLDEELRTHIDLAVEENLRRGMTVQEARTAALWAFGGVTQAKERYRVGQGLPPLEVLGRDVRYGFRQLRKSPGFTLTVVLTLALGIGANTAVFSVMNAILMQLLPVSRPEGLSYVRMPQGEHNPPGASNTGAWDTSFSEAVLEALRQRRDIFEEVIAYVPLSFTGSIGVRHGELPEEAEGEEVSVNFFSGLGARLERGRGFSLQDEKDHAPVVVLSYDYWTRSYARDPGVVGEMLYIKGAPMTVVGRSEE